MELGNKFAQLYNTISQNLRGNAALSSLYLGFVINYPLYFLERVANHLVKIGVVKNYFESSDFNKLQLNENILIEIGNSVDRDIERLSISELRKLCKEFIDLLLANQTQWRSSWIKKKSDNYTNSLRSNYIPYDFIVDIVKPSQNQVIYQPDCNIGSMFIKFNAKFPNHNLKFIGQNSDFQDENFVCKINLFANGLEKVSSIFSENPLDFSAYQNKPKADIAIATNYPHGSLYPSDDYIDVSHLESDEKIRSYEIAYIELMLSATKDNGKVIAVVPDSFLTNNQSKSFRKKYLDNDLIEMIFSLPRKDFALFDSLPASIIVLNKAKTFQNKGLVIFDGAEDWIEETRVGINQIKSENNLNLKVFRYASKESKELRNILAHSQHPVKKIRDLVEFSVLGHNYSPKDRITENSSEVLPYVRVTDLSKNDKDFSLDISRIERKISREKVRENSIIGFPAVLVSKIAPKLKPTYFNFTGQPIVIGSDIIALKMKEDVNIEYFLAQLHSRFVQIQVEMASSGATINRISKEDFLNIQIILPSLEEQTQQAIEFLKKTQKELVEDVAEAEEKIQQTEYDVIATISHNLSQKLGKIGDDYNTLIRRLNRGELKSSLKFNELFGDKEVFDIVVNRLKHNIEDASDTMTTTTRILQKNKILVELVEIIKFLKNDIVKTYLGSNFEIFIETKLKSLFVPIDKDAFKDALRNLIENAQKHGFKNSERRFHIVFEISKRISNGTEYASILYKNDGEPFPKGFSFDEFKRLGGRAGETKGTGLGGFWINKVVGLHKGRFDYIPVDMDSLSPYKVMFEILLPLE